MANDYIIKIEGSWPSGETEYVIGTEDPQRLPVVSSDDNGDVLTVVGGKWSDAAPGGGGGGGMRVTVKTADALTYTNPSKTIDEIYAAVESGVNPILTIVMEMAGEEYDIISSVYHIDSFEVAGLNPPTAVKFIHYEGDSTITPYGFSIARDGTVTVVSPK